MSLVTPSHESQSMNGVLELLSDPDELKQRIENFQRAEATAKSQLNEARLETEKTRASTLEFCNEMRAKAELEAAVIVGKAQETRREAMVVRQEAKAEKSAAVQDLERAQDAIAEQKKRAVELQTSVAELTTREQALDQKSLRLNRAATKLVEVGSAVQKIVG